MEEIVLELPVCRVCLKSSDENIEMDAFILNEFNEESQTYFECFKECTHLDIKNNDGQARHICSPCSNELCAAYDFITRARISHEILTAQSFDVTKYEHVNEEIFIDEHQKPTPSPTEATSKEDEKDVDILFMSMGDNEIVEEEIVTSPQPDAMYNEAEVVVCYSNTKGSSNESQAYDDVISVDEFNEEEIIEPVSNAVSKFKCNLCIQSFSNLDDLKEHGEQEHESAEYCCRTCFHRFSFKYALCDHIKRKHDTTYVKCNICDAYIQSCLMRSHKRKEHLNSVFLCTACPRTFKTSTGLQIHSETHKENREKNFECEQCNKKFLTERTFKVHTRTHWERKHFKCELCEKQFLQKINLKLHMQMHRGETMDCLYCEKKFVRKTDLTIHMRFHTGNFPYECTLCDKRFAIVSHLNYHKKRHQGYVYKCEICEKEFINKSGLRNHSFQHTIMPFNCLLCDKGFPTKFKIKRHLKTVHHVEENDDFERFITKDKIKQEPLVVETIEEESLQQTADD